MKTSPLLHKSPRIRRVATRATETLIALSVTGLDELFDFQHTQRVGLFVFSQIWEDADVAKCRQLPHFSSSRWRENEQIAQTLLFFFGLQPTALKSRLFRDSDSSLHQVTQHPAPIPPSILARPTQPLLPIIPLSAGCISDRRCDDFPCLHPSRILSLSLSLSNTRHQTFHGAYPPP